VSDLSSTTVRLTDPCSVPIEKHRVLGNEDLLELIFSYLETGPGTMSKVLRVVSLFRKIGVKFLWREAAIRNLLCVANDKRRREYASKITNVFFVEEEPIWPASTVICPQFNEIKSLELCATSVRANEPNDLVGFIPKALKELLILRSVASNAVAMQTASVPRDDVWISHITSKCTDLTTLKLEITLDLSTCKLATLFRAAPHLRTLHLGRELNAALDEATIMTILKLPSLDDLSLDRPLDSSFVAEMLAARNEILPQATKLHITFATSEDLAIGDLLSQLTKLQELSVVFQSGNPNQLVVPHISFLEVIGTLPELRALTLSLSSNTRLTLSGISSIARHKKIAVFNILSSGRHTSLKPAQVSFTPQELVHTPFSFRLFQILNVVEFPTPIVTYDEAIQIIHMINHVSPEYMWLFSFNVDEEVSFGWPSGADYEVILEHSTPQNSIWKGSLKAFAPDPVA